MKFTYSRIGWFTYDVRIKTIRGNFAFTRTTSDKYKVSRATHECELYIRANASWLCVFLFTNIKCLLPHPSSRTASVVISLEPRMLVVKNVTLCKQACLTQELVSDLKTYIFRIKEKLTLYPTTIAI